MEGKHGQFSYDGKINLEYIAEDKKSTYVIGIVPMLRYDTKFLNQNFFIRGGIGTNYINNHVIGSRDIGGNFIFSDMLSLGIHLL